MAEKVETVCFLLIVFSSIACVQTCFASETIQGDQCHIWVTSVSDTINPMVAQYIGELIKKGEQTNINALILELDTPGGLVESTHHIVVAIMNAKIPIITYVSPQGARAASAGMFIAIASHVAAMAPATNIGAAHPVSMGPIGPIVPEKPENGSNDSFTYLSKAQSFAGINVRDEKVLNDLLAWARAIAEQKNRNPEWVEQSIRFSKSSTEREALEAGVIDLISIDKSDLIRQLQGRAVQIGDREIDLDLSDCRVEMKSMSWRQNFLSTLINPTLLIYLLAIGALGLYFELAHPGLIVPGVVGGISLILGLFAMHSLPINTAGLLLILLSFVFFALEVKMTSYGVLTIGGITSFVLGAAMLVDSDISGMRVSLKAIIPLAVGVALITIVLIALVVSSHRKQVSTGDVGLIGKIGIVTRALNPSGQIYIRGEIWCANSLDGSIIPEDTEIVVTDITGLTLTVKPVQPTKRKE